MFLDKVENINWADLIKPSQVEYSNVSSDHAEIVIEPLELGYGHTIGNSLRRILLNSIYGAAVIAVKIEGVEHEFASIDGVKEDVVSIVMNLKKIVPLLGGSASKKTFTLNAKGPGVITAANIELGSDDKILNPEQVICTLSDDVEISMSITCGVGRGYSPASDQRELYKDDISSDVIYIDALYSPVRNVSYKVENARVGRVTNYDKLVISVDTNGLVKPEIAVGIAARILQDQLSVLINFEEDKKVQTQHEKEVLPFSEALLKKVDELELTVRSQNCLKDDNITYIGDLVVKTEAQMLKVRNFGRKSLIELRKVLKTYDLTFGMDVPEWPPQDIEKLAKQYGDSY